MVVAMEVERKSSERMELLLESFDKCLGYGLRNPSALEFFASFPEIPEPVVDALLDLYRQVLLNIEANAKAEFVEICNEYGVQNKLSQIEGASHHVEASGQSDPSEQRSSLPDTGSNVHAEEVKARYLAQQAEMAFLQHTMEQTAAERARLSAVLKERRGQVSNVQQGYMDVALDVGKVYEASRCWYEVK